MKAGREDVGEGGHHPIHPCDEAFLRVVEVGSGLQIGEDHLRDPFIVLSVLPNGYPPIVPDRDNPLLGIDSTRISLSFGFRRCSSTEFETISSKIFRNA